jgi:hypothetical protein
MCAVVRLRALMARQAARLITNPPFLESTTSAFTNTGENREKKKERERERKRRRKRERELEREREKSEKVRTFHCFLSSATATDRSSLVLHYTRTSR